MIVQYLYVGMIDYSAGEVEELFRKACDCAIPIHCWHDCLQRWRGGRSISLKHVIVQYLYVGMIDYSAGEVEELCNIYTLLA